MPLGARRRAVSPGIPKAQEACAWPNPAPPISPGPPASSMTARCRAAARPSAAGSPWKRRLSQRPRARFARAGEDAGAPGGTARRNRAPQPRTAPPGYPGTPEPPPSLGARPHRVPQIPQLRIPQSRIWAPRRRTAPPGYPGTPGTPLFRTPARLASRKSRNCEPAIPDTGAAPARRPARLSRNSCSAPVPKAHPPRVPQIPQLRIPQSRIRAPRRSARPAPRAGRNGSPAMPAARRAGEGAGDG